MNATTGNEIDPAGVNHPKHYNQHRSGIECIALVRALPFGLGSAVKYLWRADLKGTPLKDLKKAQWYIEDTLDNLCPCNEPGDDTAPQTVYIRQLREQVGKFESAIAEVLDKELAEVGNNLSLAAEVAPTQEECAIMFICDSVLRSNRTCLLQALDIVKQLIIDNSSKAEA
jgi:hypothetical protein